MNENIKDAQRYDSFAATAPDTFTATFWRNTAHRLRTKLKDYVPESARVKPKEPRRRKSDAKRIYLVGDTYELPVAYSKNCHRKFYQIHKETFDAIIENGFFVSKDLPNGKQVYRFVSWFVQEGYTVTRQMRTLAKRNFYVYTITP